jgi:hypothetical protein
MAGALSVLWVAWLLLRTGWVLISIELVAIGLMVAADRYYSPQIDRWLQGARAEQEVGRILDQLEEKGWFVLHDVSLGRGNVDHILIGPGGIFTIETKSRKTPLALRQVDTKMLKQAYAQKKLIERVTGYKAQPVLVFVAPWIIGKVPTRRSGVVILPVRMLEGFTTCQKHVVTVERARTFHIRLAGALSSS